MKKFLALALALVMLFSLMACSNESGNSKTNDSSFETTSSAVDENNETTAENVEAETITVTDHLGNTVTLPAKIERIAISGIFPLASVLTVFFNSAEKIVAMPAASLSAAKGGLLGQLYPEILNVETECVSGDEINVEELLKLEPDVVFYSDTAAATGDMLREAGFNAVGLSVSKWDYNCIETLNNWMTLLSEMFPEDAKADVARVKTDEVYAMITERVADIPEEQRARIFTLFQYNETTMLTSSKYSFGQFWCDAINAINVGDESDKNNSVAVNMEQVYAWNPEIIFVTNFTPAQTDDIYNNTIGEYDWSGVDAVTSGRVYKMPLGMYRSYTPGVDTPITLLWVAKTVYPDLFADVDVTVEAKAYYKDVFGIELSDEQIETIFAPVSDAASDTAF